MEYAEFIDINPEHKLNDSFILEEFLIDDSILLEEISSLDLFYMADEVITFGKDTVPFHATCLDNNYDIIYDLLAHIEPLYKDKILKNGQTPLFNVNDKLKLLIGISSKANLLNKYSFCNKLMELFDILVDYHNRINTKLGKPIITSAEARSLWTKTIH